MPFHTAHYKLFNLITSPIHHPLVIRKAPWLTGLSKRRPKLIFVLFPIGDSNNPRYYSEVSGWHVLANCHRNWLVKRNCSSKPLSRTLLLQKRPTLCHFFKSCFPFFWEVCGIGKKSNWSLNFEDILLFLYRKIQFLRDGDRCCIWSDSVKLQWVRYH